MGNNNNKKKAEPELDGRILDRLFAVVDSRKDADPGSSYTAKLMRRVYAYIRSVAADGQKTPPSSTRMARSTSMVKSTCPGVSTSWIR